MSVLSKASKNFNQQATWAIFQRPQLLWFYLNHHPIIPVEMGIRVHRSPVRPWCHFLAVCVLALVIRYLMKKHFEQKIFNCFEKTAGNAWLKTGSSYNLKTTTVLIVDLDYVTWSLHLVCRSSSILLNPTRIHKITRLIHNDILKCCHIQ